MENLVLAFGEFIQIFAAIIVGSVALFIANRKMSVSHLEKKEIKLEFKIDKIWSPLLDIFNRSKTSTKEGIKFNLSKGDFFTIREIYTQNKRYFQDEKFKEIEEKIVNNTSNISNFEIDELSEVCNCISTKKIETETELNSLEKKLDETHRSGKKQGIAISIILMIIIGVGFFVYYNQESNNVEISPTETPESGLGLTSFQLINAKPDTVYFILTGDMKDDGTAHTVHRELTINSYQKRINHRDSDHVNLYGYGVKYNKDLVLFGGTVSNDIVTYYEKVGYALIKFENDTESEELNFVRKDGMVVRKIPYENRSSKTDYFVIQVYNVSNKQVLSMWGLTENGTVASGIFFVEEILPNLTDYEQNYYICRWIDQDEDRLKEAHEIEIINSGN